MRATSIALLALLSGGTQAADIPAGDPVRGETLWTSRCIACHAIDANKVGPPHRGVVGRKAGTAAGYAYSSALATAGFVWDAGKLDAWLADPRALVPGAKMAFRVGAPQDRADLIAYLATLNPATP